MTNKHTPGPWRTGDSPYDVIAEEYRVVATAAHDRQGLRRGREESVANASLIAAAPELLALVRAHLLTYPDDEYTERIDALLARLDRP